MRLEVVLQVVCNISGGIRKKLQRLAVLNDQTGVHISNLSFLWSAEKIHKNASSCMIFLQQQVLMLTRVWHPIVNGMGFSCSRDSSYKNLLPQIPKSMHARHRGKILCYVTRRLVHTVCWATLTAWKSWWMNTWRVRGRGWLRQSFIFHLKNFFSEQCLGWCRTKDDSFLMGQLCFVYLKKYVFKKMEKRLSPSTHPAIFLPNCRIRWLWKNLFINFIEGLPGSFEDEALSTGANSLWLPC